MIPKLGLLAILICCAGLPRLAEAMGTSVPEYTIRDLGLLPGARFSTGYALNDRGQVIGHSLFPPPPPGGSYSAQVHLWTDGSLLQLPAPSATSYGPYMGINAAGQVAFTSGSTPFLYFGGVCWNLNSITSNLPAPLRNVNGINEFGEILVKGYALGSGHERTYLWKDGKVTDIGSLGGPSASGYGFNNNAEIVGMSRNATGAYRPFFWRQGKFEDMGVPSGAHATSSFPTPWAVNHDRVAVGRVYSTTFQTLPARWWRDASTGRWSSAILPTFDGQATGVNDAGVIVGNAYTPRAAFVYSAAKGSRRLADLVSLTSDWTVLSEAWAINASGQIVGIGTRSDGTSHGFLLTPR